jgi:hypothetical protein
MLPRRIRFFTTDRNKGDKRNQKIIDSTGAYGARTLTSGMHSGLTSPARLWFTLGTPDPDLAKFGSVKSWLNTVTLRMHRLFATTNLYNSLPTVYGDMGVFATAAMAVLDDGPDVMRTYTFPLGSYVLGMDERGLCTTFFREYELTVRNVVRTFGGERGMPAVPGQPIDWRNISRAVQDLWNDGSYEQAVQILWVVAPNPEADASRLGAKYFPWVSCHFERLTAEGEGNKILRESGFKTFPIMAPRWNVTDGDSYGTSCPGMDVLGDVKQLQGMQRKKGQAVEKSIDPPLSGPTSLRTQKTSLLPGDITYVDTRDGMQGLRAIHEIGLNLNHMTLDLRETQERVREGFYADLWLMMSQSDAPGIQPITAEEVRERHEEKMLVLGPVLQRTNDELLNPLIDRTYALMEAAGMIPPVPQELDGVKLRVDYISILAQAQKLVGVVGLDRFSQTMVNLGGVYPEVRRKLRAFKLVDEYADKLGVDPDLVVPDDEAQKAVDADNRQQQAMAAAATAAQGAKAAQTASQTPLDNGDTALTRVMQTLGTAAPGQ